MPGISEPTQIAMLLTLRFDTASTSALKPLDAAEMGKLANWFRERGFCSADLLERPKELLVDWQDRRIPAERVLRLLERGELIERKVELWSREGIWIVGRKDEGYPRGRLDKHLGDSIPPVLFGIGNRDRLAGGGTAIVGSRDARIQTLRIAERLGADAAGQGATVISGGARGVDERAVEGALAANGAALVVLGDSLIKTAARKFYREFLDDGTLALASPYSPDIGFTSGNAMGRNRLIYCLADEAIVVASVNGIGGTYGGAKEAVRRAQVPIRVVPSDEPDSGNALLVADGATWLPEERMPVFPRAASER